jgi:AmmeMemoRadiSam system protein B
MNIRPAAVAGMFYPGDSRTLSHDVRTMLADAEVPALHPEGHKTRHDLRPHPCPPPQAGEEEDDSLREFHVKAIIAPHAGYIYSGPVAASAYALLQPFADQINRVILLGPTHRVAVRGLALPGADAFDTPLGRVKIDIEAARMIAGLPQVTVSAEAHMLEHSLEVHLPFLQTVLRDFRLLPLAVGMTSAEEVAEVLETLWGGPETLIVISSDLSHYHAYLTAQRIDSATVEAILHGQTVSHEQACGGTPVNGLTLAAQRHGLAPHLLDLRNSGDTAGDKSRVVGYAAIAYTE